MTICRLALAAIMVLLLGPPTLSGLAMAAPVNPIVAFNDFYRDSQPTGYLLGGSAGGQWVKPEAAAGLIPGGEQYRLYTLTGEVGSSVGGKPAKGEDGPCSDTLYVTLDPLPDRPRQPGGGGRPLECHAPEAQNRQPRGAGL